MQLRPNASSRPRAGAAKERRISEQAFAEALTSRDEWRVEIEARASCESKPVELPQGDQSRRNAPRTDATARFAAAIARAELKRFHWDERREKEFQRLKNGRRLSR